MSAATAARMSEHGQGDVPNCSDWVVETFRRPAWSVRPQVSRSATRSLADGSIGTLRNVHAYAKSKGDKGSTPAGNCPSRLANQKQFITRSHTSTVFFLFLRFRFPQKYQNMLLALGVGAE